MVTTYGGKNVNRKKALKKPRVSVVEENPGWGLYAWRKSNGQIFMDEDNNLLNIPSRYGDLEKIAQITQAAAHYGEPEGKACFHSRRAAYNRRRIQRAGGANEGRNATNHERLWCCKGRKACRKGSG